MEIRLSGRGRGSQVTVRIEGLQPKGGEVHLSYSATRDLQVSNNVLEFTIAYMVNHDFTCGVSFLFPPSQSRVLDAESRRFKLRVICPVTCTQWTQTTWTGQGDRVSVITLQLSSRLSWKACALPPSPVVRQHFRRKLSLSLIL